ncbi:MAG: hypothetical protein MI802_03345, partial [Desulfobacterales bacterium]|nr:hypothetical protein [Desulfobacterales bacterium]
MPVNIDILDFRCFNQLRNGEDFDRNLSDFTPNLVGNIGEKIRVTFKANVSQSSFTESLEEWEIFPALTEIRRSSGSFLDDAVQVGDQYEFFADWAARKNGSVEYTGTVDFISSDGRILRYTVDSGTDSTSGVVTNVGLSFDQLNITNRNGAAFLKFGLLDNNETFNYLSKVTEALQVYYRGSIIPSPLFQMESLGTIKDWVTGEAFVTLESAAPDFKDAQYSIRHDFVLNPFFILAYREFIDNDTIPDLLAGDNS